MELRNGEIWQHFIRNGINPDRLLNNHPEPLSVDMYLQQSARIRHEFIDRMLVESASTKNEKQVRALVYGYQTLICYLVNELNVYMAHVQQENVIIEIYKGVINDLDNILLFIQTYFTRYFDFQASVPVLLRDHFQKAVLQLEAQFPVTWQGDASHTELQILFLSLLHRYAEGPLSFAQHTYLTGLINGIYRSPYGLPNLFELPLIDYCIVQNFNAPEITAFVIAFLAEKLRLFESDQQKKEWIRHCLKQLYQLAPTVSTGILEEQVSLRDNIANWLEQEKLFWAVHNKDMGAVFEPGPKLNTSVSVPVLALFTRLFKETGIITNANLQEVFRFVASNYTSQQKESISTGNFHGKYYTVEESTKRKVTDLLLEMVKAVKRIQ